MDWRQVGAGRRKAIGTLFLKSRKWLAASFSHEINLRDGHGEPNKTVTV